MQIAPIPCNARCVEMFAMQDGACEWSGMGGVRGNQRGSVKPVPCQHEQTKRMIGRHQVSWQAHSNVRNKVQLVEWIGARCWGLGC